MPKLSRIAPELPVANLREALDHYQQKLGFRVTVQTPDGDYAIVERDDIALHLFQVGAVVHTPVAIHIFASDLDALYAEYHRRGARLTQDILRKPWGNRDFRLKDTFGNELKFTEPLAED
ncbi:MAG: VOC family protein [Terracidiphilus sp.]